MITYNVLAGSADKSVVIRIVDSTDGTPETAVTSGTAGLALEYRREGATSTAITESDLAALDSAHSDGGMKHIGNGYYRLDLPDAAVAAGSAGCLVHGTVTGMVVMGCYVDLTPVPSDVRQFGGTAGTFSGGRAEVNLSHIAGAAVSATTAQLGVNVVQVSADATAADNLELAFDGTGYAGGATPQQVVLTTSGKEAVADQVWDEAISDHRASGSFGARFQVKHAGTCQAGGSTTTVVLAAGASASDDYYNDDLIVGWVAADGTNQFSDYITGYVGATRTATVTGIPVSPGATYSYIVIPAGTIPGATAPTAAQVADAVWDEAASGHTAAGTYGQFVGGEVTRAGTAQAGTTSSITLDASASATNNLYRYHRVEIIGGTGAGQASYITAYTGASKVATVDPAFAVAPSSDSIFILRKMGLDAATPAIVADAVWDEARSGHTTAGSFGEYVPADATRLSGDATAADNLEAAFDGTGYAFPASSIAANVTQISGDATAADNLEAALDGTGGVTISAALTGNITGNITGNLSGSVGSVTGNVGGNVTGSVGSLAAQAKADVNAEVVDALNVDTYTEPGQEAPGVNVSLVKKIGYLYKAWRNKSTQTATQYTLYADNTTTVDQKATVSDDGTTATKAEVATGP